MFFENKMEKDVLFLISVLKVVLNLRKIQVREKPSL